MNCVKAGCNILATQGEYCPMHLREKGYEIKESQIPGAGLGVYCVRDILKNELVGPYDGVILDSKEVDEADSDYIIQVENDRFIDAIVETSCFTRYINDRTARTRKKYPELHLKPNNCYFAYNTTTKICNVRARIKIKAGEELGVPYGAQYWRDKEKKEKQTAIKGTKRYYAVKGAVKQV